MVKYNKSFQNQIDLSLINYKLYSGRYVKYENNKIAKEYSAIDEHIIYEGEYLSGNRHGKGKEFYEEDELIFEGEYFNGKSMEKEKNFMK